MTIILVNGREDSCIDVRDRGFQYGDGLFETIAYKNNQLQFWDEHLQRMQQGCERLSLTKVDEATWLADIKKLHLTGDAVVKLSISRGVSGRGYVYDKTRNVTRVVAVYPWPNYAASNPQGITATFCKTPVSVNPVLAGIKHLNRLDNVLARNEWNDDDIAEGFMMDHNQHVIEGTMSNVFCVSGSEIYTPSLEHCGVAGIMRQQVIKAAKETGKTVNIIEISQQNFMQMDEVFITNSLIGLWPVKTVIDEHKQVSFDQNEIVDQIKRQLQSVVSS